MSQTGPHTVWAFRGRPGTGSWDLTRTEHGFVLRDEYGELAIPAAQATRIVVTRRWWRTKVSITGAPEPSRSRLRGLTRTQAQTLAVAVHNAALEALTRWYEKVIDTVSRAERELRWIPEETTTALATARPNVHHHGLSVELLTDRERTAMALTDQALRDWIGMTNRSIADQSLVRHRQFFDSIERSPLTEEQARAVVTYDNRVHVIAAAGSGKTSLMVGRAAYAVHRGFATPDKVLLLAFNKDAAVELKDRVETRFTAAGIPSTGVRATTFHAFGLDIIGQVTGKKPAGAVGRRRRRHEGAGRHRRSAPAARHELRGRVGHVPAAVRACR